MTKQNPFTFVFGKVPRQCISRLASTSEVINTFDSDIPKSQVYLITGVRGSGKTVLMTEIAKKIENRNNWIVIHLNPENDLLSSLASKLYENSNAKGLFADKSFGISLVGINASVNISTPITNAETIVEKMLKILKKRNKKLLITIDEVSSSPQTRAFVSAFQIFVREDYPVFLLMTGLYENIRSLQDEKNLTFLYRAPKIELGPLNLTAVCNSYEEIFNISQNEAVKLAKYTNGYSFAYQVLGYLLWEHNTTKVTTSIEREYDNYLVEFVYEKIWNELSEGDRSVLIAMTKTNDLSSSNIAKIANISTNQFSIYKKRLSKKGLIDNSKRGFTSFTLPRFAEFVKIQIAFEF